MHISIDVALIVSMPSMHAPIHPLSAYKANTPVSPRHYMMQTCYLKLGVFEMKRVLSSWHRDVGHKSRAERLLHVLHRLLSGSSLVFYSHCFQEEIIKELIKLDSRGTHQGNLLKYSVPRVPIRPPRHQRRQLKQ